ncbi:Protein odr-4-like [Holothuria leucospilota]|uniref:Protein odr-4-like n=1 Tax=Holothuria leucospilota TaxID=206669 RepID=A0A9Q1H9W8_HOLLE|nr:Protein odr-4-like [Holothuria leucospilota]
MVKSILAEEFLQDYISSLCDASRQCTVGLIAGHKSSQKDYAVALLPTPSEDDDEEEEEPSEGRPKKQKKCMNTVNEQWVAEHARQVMRMLPGGLSVMGIYVAASEEELASSQSKQRQILFAIFKMFQKKQVMDVKNEDSLDWSILQISTKTKKLTCKTFNVADSKSIAKPAEWKFQSFVNSWSCVSCQLQVNLRIPFKECFRDCSHYSKFVVNGVENLLNAVRESMVLINGQLRDEKNAIETLLGKKKSGKKSAPSSASQSLDINAELLMESAVLGPSQQLESTIAGDTNIVGWIQAKGYISPRSTFGDVEKVIKEDIQRSLQVRFDLLAEELRQSSGDEEVKELDIEPPSIIATPQRVFVKLPNTPILVSDYVFQDEEPKDVSAHFLELLNISVIEEEVDFSCEQMPDESLLQQIETASSHSSDVASLDELLKPGGGGGNAMKYAGAAIAGVGAVLALGMSYLAISQE